jgi:hypothetical protein
MFFVVGGRRRSYDPALAKAPLHFVERSFLRRQEQVPCRNLKPFHSR